LKCPICQSTRAYVATDGKHQFAYCLACKIKLEPQVALDKEVAKVRRQESQDKMIEIFARFLSRNFRKIGIAILIVAISFGAKTSLDSRQASKLVKEACAKWPDIQYVTKNEKAEIAAAGSLFEAASVIDSQYTNEAATSMYVLSFLDDRKAFQEDWDRRASEPFYFQPDLGSSALDSVVIRVTRVRELCNSREFPMYKAETIPEIAIDPSPTKSSESLKYLSKNCATIEIGNYKRIFAAGNAYTTCEMVTPFQDSILSGSEIQTTVTARVLIDATKQTYKEVTLYAYLNGPMDNISITYTSRKPIDMNAFMESVLNYDDSLLTENDILIFLVQP
jgi:hypothetical protein